MEVVPTVKNIEVSAPWADHIFDGTKKVEVRKNDPAGWGATQEGDLLRVVKTGTSESKAFRVKVIRRYKNLDACLIGEGVSKLLPGLYTLQQAREVYLGFDGPQSQDKRWQEFNKFGAVAMELEPLERKLSTERPDSPKSKNTIINVPSSAKRAWIKYNSGHEVRINLSPDVRSIEIGFEYQISDCSTLEGPIIGIESSGDMVASRYAQKGVIVNPIMTPDQFNEKVYRIRSLKDLPQSFVTANVPESAPTSLDWNAATNVMSSTARDYESALKRKADSAKEDLLKTHIQGSSNPKGHPDCTHRLSDGKSLIEYNDDTMEGIGSQWHRMCSGCGKVWKEDE